MDSLDNLLSKIEKSQDIEKKVDLAKKFLKDSIGTGFSGGFVFFPQKSYNRNLELTVKYILDDISKGKLTVLHDTNRLRNGYSGTEISNVIMETYKTFLLSDVCQDYGTHFVDYLLQNKDKIINYSNSRKLLLNVQKYIIHCEKRIIKGTIWQLLLPIETILSYEDKNLFVFIEKINETFMKDENPAIRLKKIADLISSKTCKTAEEIYEVSSLDLPEGYKPIKKLGKGGSGSVYLVEITGLNSKKRFKALKILDLKGHTEDILRAINSELQVEELNDLHCQYITTNFVFPHKGKFIISMDPYEKTLADRLEETKGRLPLPEAMRYFEQLCEALTVCHSNGIVHKDFAPHNIGIDSNGNIKLSDFGNPLTTIDKKLMPPPLDYSSPRILASEKKLDVLPQDNVWSLGVLLYKMVTGKLPFSNSSLPRCERTERDKYIMRRHEEYQKKGFDYLIENTSDLEIKNTLFAVHSLFTSTDALQNLYESIRQRRLDDLIKNKGVVNG